jgi:hypothetical protein
VVFQKIKDLRAKAKQEISHFNYVKTQASEYAHRKLWWDEICRQISPDIFNILKNRLEIDDFLVECILVGKNQGTTEGIPGEMAYTFQKKLFDTALKGCIIQVTEALVPIPTEEAQGMIQEAIYFNEGNQKTYIEGNELGVANINLSLDKRDMHQQAEVLHDNKENFFHGAYVVTIWAASEKEMITAKSHVKGVMREHRILGELPIRRMYDAFLTGQPYPEMADFTIIDMWSGLASILSPTVNPLSPLAGTGEGVYIGHEVLTGKDIALDFWSEAAPHALIIGATGSGKTYLIILLMIRLYLEGRKVMYLTKKRDEHTKYRAVCEYFGENGTLIEIGRGNRKHQRHNINPLQIIYDESMADMLEDEAMDIYDNQKDLVCASIKVYCKDEYSTNMDSLIDETLDNLYKEKGISRKDTSTWKNPFAFPLMKDIPNYLDEIYPAMKGSRKATCQALKEKLRKFREDGTFDFINRPTDVVFKRFSVIDIVSVPKGLKEFMNVYITGILSSQVSVADSNGLSIIIDEGGAFLRDPDLADTILTGLTQWRSQNTQLIFATQQFEDLKAAKMSEVFMANTFFKIIFGANMDESVVPFVQNFLHLKESQKEELMTLQKGQCLIKQRNQYVKCQVTASDEEHAIIKGLKVSDTLDTSTIKETVQIMPYTVKSFYKSISDSNKIIFESWLEGEFSKKALQDAGYMYYNLPRALDSGSVSVYIHQSLSGADKLIMNQTPDHYSTVIQIPAYFMEMAEILKDVDITDIEINHHNDVDFSLKINGETHAFEFERDGTHTVEQIKEKFLRNKLVYDHVYIISMSSNAKRCQEAVEDPERMKQKLPTLNTKPRGAQLKDFIDTILKNAQKPPTQADFIHNFKEEETITEDLSDELKNITEKPLHVLELEPVFTVFEENGAL